ncbi:MAG: hypothetical protein A2927_01155 [Candidatus Komeilibacteria bacterium RIFCSPLOWO2_01_FULL_45_10]|uniref:Phosphate transport regulator n=1 Tax=Candidatus Komeilibacteria bacterium RIFCSPLOWO2_01_FULL_45_10 TaxID=1798550 RepID=A0A1G2BL53_9BACT|nr:MAG: hypothetical protein A2927_01155 [Candidatus Komeilibacteria bacterium RIFCSPLOWO2_01_FULL_45_10]
MKLSFLIPKQPIFFKLFSELGQKVFEISTLFTELTKAQEAEIDDYVQRAVDIEHQADDITHEIVNQLNKTFITPFDREDIYTLAEELDDIIDQLEDVIHNIDIYHVNPKEKFLSDFAEIILKDGQAMKELAEKLKSQKYSSEFRELILKIHELEDDGDEIFLSFMSELFQNGQNPVTIIKLKVLAEGLEEIIDKFQKASNVCENILVKSQ